MKLMRMGGLFGVFVLTVVVSLCRAEGVRPNASGAREAVVRITMEPVLTSGLSQPLLVTNARDGSNRLFIVEQTGLIKVLQPGKTVPTVFLDLTPKVLIGSEQGLLGLTFHPRYSSNRRFFVNYTRKPDGATVVAEYNASNSSPDTAETVETVLLVIDQPYANHNGGMVEFGPDGFLYIGMGDGGSANDPENRAQNPQILLGKILRIDVDKAEGGKPYAIPPSNPYTNSGAGRPEIFALGLRNPWRFSFDRVTGRLFAADVGQGANEEIDVVKAGGNYGWRVCEGTRCTALGPAACTTPGFIPPIAEYTHELGRCSVTGGYVYRGSRNALPLGTYVYGDYCSGEIFMLKDGAQTLLAKTGLNIASFGEDEAGEIYVCGLGGTVHRIVNPDAPAHPLFYFPRVVTAGGRSPGQDQFTGFAVTNLDSSAAALTFKAFDSNGVLLQGAGITNPRTLNLQGGDQLALVDAEIFGSGFVARNGKSWVQMESNTERLASFFLAFDTQLSMLDGGIAGPLTPMSFLLPEVDSGGLTQIHLANPAAQAVTVDLELFDSTGSSRARATRSISANGLLAEASGSLFPGIALGASDYVRGSASGGVVPFEFLLDGGRFTRGLNGQDATAGSTILYCPQYVTGGGYRSVLAVVNLENEPGSVTFRFFRDDGSSIGTLVELSVPAKGKIFVNDPGFFGNLGPGLSQGFIEIRSSGPLLAGSVVFADFDGRAFSTALPLVTTLQSRLVYSQLASNSTYFTGLSIANPGSIPANALIEVFDKAGRSIASAAQTIPANGRVSELLTEYFPALAEQDIDTGYIKITSDGRVASFAVFGTNNLSTLAAIPAQIR